MHLRIVFTDMKRKATIRREITLWCEAVMREQGVDGWYLVDRSGWPQCPMVNPLCPVDLCILPAGHAGTAEGYHVLGTTAYSAAEQFPLEWMVPTGASVAELYLQGVHLAEIMFPDDVDERSPT
jgi:hypothetical protein